MIAIISEHRYSKDELARLKEQRVTVNYTLLPQFYQSYSEEITRINYMLIRKSNGIIFRLKDYYAGTKEAIEYALYLKKQVKIITPEGQEYKLSNKEEWKQSYKDKDNRNVAIKHLVLIEFERRRSEYYDNVNTIKAKEKYAQVTADITESKEEIERMVRALAPEYKMDVNYADWVELCQVYKSIKFYFENNIPYDLTTNEVFTKGITEPSDTIYFTGEMFVDTPYSSDIYEEESYGDETLLEDVIYKGGVC